MSSSSSDASAASAVVAGAGGLPKVVATHSSGARVEVYLHGATVTSYVLPTGQDLLFVSSKAVFDGVKAIRGGIPIAFPQFAAQGPLPMHGVARTATWTLDAVGDGSVTLSLADTEATRAVWPHAFKLVYRVSFDGTALGTALEVHNPSSSPAPFPFEALLHTYLATGEGRAADAVHVAGLAGARYLDKPSGGAACEQGPGESFPLAGAEVDRIYTLPATNEVTVTGTRIGGGAGGEGAGAAAVTAVRVQRRAGVRDAAPALKQVVEAVPVDVVVWNAGPAKCASIADFGPDDWRSYVCIEPGRVSAPYVLAPGKVFTLTQTLVPVLE
jgi:glucose-6-phosphate 1-epimerase